MGILVTKGIDGYPLIDVVNYVHTNRLIHSYATQEDGNIQTTRGTTNGFNSRSLFPSELIDFYCIICNPPMFRHNTPMAHHDAESLINRSSLLVLILLLCGDFIFIVLHIINALTHFSDSQMFNVESDGGYPEIYQYAKYLLIMVALTYRSFKYRSPPLLIWVVFFLYLFLDDSLQIHEKGGSFIAERLHLVMPFSRSTLQDYGELIITLVAATVLLPFLLWAYKGGSEVFRAVSRNLFLLLCVLIFFGVIVDFGHAAIKPASQITFLLGLMEDGGEMLSASVIVWYAFYMKTGR